MNIIEACRVYDVNSPKLRIGKVNDGGYVINELIEANTTKLISVGMGNEDSFEVDWFSRYPNTQIEAYDGTYPCQQLCCKYPEMVNKRIFYTNTDVGYAIDTCSGTTDQSRIALNAIVDGKPNVLLKVDVEGAEYNIFDNIRLSNVTGLILEVHDLHLVKNQIKLVELMETSFADLVLFHVHGNAWGNTFTLNLSGTGINSLPVKEFPIVMEMCFINRNLAGPVTLATNTFPVAGVDSPNNPDAPDIDLYWVNTL